MARLCDTLRRLIRKFFGMALATVVGTVDVVLMTADLWGHGNNTLQSALWNVGSNLLHRCVVLFNGLWVGS